MAETPSKVTVHCPSCGVEVEVVVQVAGVVRASDSIGVQLQAGSARHVCRDRPYVEPHNPGLPFNDPRQPRQVTGR